MTFRPADRYGRHARAMPGRPVLAGLFAAVVLAGVVVAILSYRNLGDPEIDAKVLGFDPPTATEVQVRYAVQRDDPDRAVVCVVRARAEDGVVVGRAERTVPPGPRTTEDAVLVHTERLAVVAEVESCHYGG